MKALYVVCYDISKTARRNKVVDVLEYHGQRKNKSVFECWLSRSQYKKMLEDLHGLFDTDTDCLLVYKLCRSCVNQKIEYPYSGPEKSVGFV